MRLLILLWVASFFSAGDRVTASRYYETWSPDGRYQVVGYRTFLIYSSIGGSGDAPGYVQLRDREGNILNQGQLLMVGEVYNTRWYGKFVSAGDDNYWELP